MRDIEPLTVIALEAAPRLAPNPDGSGSAVVTIGDRGAGHVIVLGDPLNALPTVIVCGDRPVSTNELRAMCDHADRIDAEQRERDGEVRFSPSRKSPWRT